MESPLKKARLDTKFWTMFNNEKPRRYAANKDATIGDVYLRNNITSFTIKCGGETYRPWVFMEDVKTTETSYLKITERIVYYWFDEYIREYKQSYSDWLICVFDEINECIVYYWFDGYIREYKQSYSDQLICVFDEIKCTYLVAHHNGNCLNKYLLRNIQTNARSPLDVLQCLC